MMEENDKEAVEANERRAFMGVAAVGAAAMLAGCLPERVRKDPQGKTRFGMLIDLRKCYGCNACVVACKAEFDVPLGVWRSWVTEVERGKGSTFQRDFVPVLCNHCSDSPCTTVCPTNASYQRPNGIVDIKEEKCIGCKACIASCPYGTRFLEPVKKVVNKCDFCKHRSEQGVVPSCVNTCPANARIFGDLNDPNSEISKLLCLHSTQVIKPEQKTGPSVYYIGLDNTVAQAIQKPKRRSEA